MKIYVTFGQNHSHCVNGKTFDKDCVAVVHGKDLKDCHGHVVEAFDNKWCMTHSTPESCHIEHYPRGFIDLNGASE